MAVLHKSMLILYKTTTYNSYFFFMDFILPSSMLSWYLYLHKLCLNQLFHRPGWKNLQNVQEEEATWSHPDLKKWINYEMIENNSSLNPTTFSVPLAQTQYCFFVLNWTAKPCIDLFSSFSYFVFHSLRRWTWTDLNSCLVYSLQLQCSPISRTCSHLCLSASLVTHVIQRLYCFSCYNIHLQSV